MLIQLQVLATDAATQPNAELNLISHPARLDSHPGHLTIAFGFVAVNLGAKLPLVADRSPRPKAEVHD